MASVTITSQIPPSRSVGDPNHTTDHDVIQTSTGILSRLAGRGPDWHNAVEKYGADPTNTTDSTTAIQNALNACPSGGGVFLPSMYWTGSAFAQAIYKVTGQITIPAQVTLIGGFVGYRASSCAKIAATTLTTGSVITFAAATPAGAICNVEIDGTGLPAGAVDGIGCYVNSKQGSIIGVEVHNMTQHGINITQNGGNPDGWYLHEVTSHDNAGNGVNWDYAVDGQFDVFHLDHNNNGLAVGTLNNMSISNGKCQQNTTYGYVGTGGFAKTNSSFVGCMSENNLHDGWHLDFSTGGGQGSLTLSGCGARDDGFGGTSGSGYSGLYLNPKNADITIVGFNTYVTSSTGGAGTIGPDYGLQLVGTLANVTIVGGHFVGTVAGYHDGGGNTGTIQKLRVLEAIGQEGSLTSRNIVTTSPGVATAFAPADPTGTTSHTLVHMGFGSTCAVTPKGSGKMLVHVTGIYNDTVAETGAIGARFGTGTAPANAAAVTGTRFGGATDPSIGPAAASRPCGFGFTDLLTLTVGTAYWFDIVVDNGASGTGTVTPKNVSMSFVEV